MTDTNLVGRVLELQSQRITRLQQAIDKLTTEIQANGDTLERIHRTLNEGGAK